MSRKSGDIRNSFVTYNTWNGKVPCPNCLPKVNPMRTPCPDNLNGVARIVGQNTSTGKYVWACYDCKYQEEK